MHSMVQNFKPQKPIMGGGWENKYKQSAAVAAVTGRVASIGTEISKERKRTTKNVVRGP